MTSANRTLFKLLSLCLSYPDAETLGALPEMEAAAAGLADPFPREPLSAFLALLRARPLLDLQEHYTATFDLNPAASLNLTWHLLGDREDRGRALAELLEVYRQAGFEPAVDDLPDHLPLLLEFMAAAPQVEVHPLVERCLSALPAITGCLRENGSLYAHVLEVLCGVVSESTSDAQTH
jgi:nitrate reductase delta subunit